MIRQIVFRPNGRRRNGKLPRVGLKPQKQEIRVFFAFSVAVYQRYSLAGACASTVSTDIVPNQFPKVPY